MQDGYKKLLQGYRSFREKYSKGEIEMPDLSLGQNPQVLVISCSDSRIVPNLILGAPAGDIFAVRNIANIVPPYDERHTSYHGTSAAIEYAVKSLKVKHIIILGHTNCGGIEALVKTGAAVGTDFVGKWMEIVSPALTKVSADKTLTEKQRCCECEKESLKISLKNLNAFPFVRQAVKQNLLQTHAMIFDIKTFALSRYNGDKDLFEDII